MKRNHTSFLKEIYLTLRNQKRIPRYAVIESWKDKGISSHMVIETPEHLSIQHFKLIVREAWERTKDGIIILKKFIIRRYRRI